MALDTDNTLITLAQFYSHAGISATEQTAQSEIFENIINGVSNTFNRYTNRKLKARDLTEFYDGDNTATLLVNEYPINSSVSEIEIYIDVDREYGADTQVDSTDIIIYSDEGQIKIEDGSFSRYPHAVKIVYNAGFAIIPYDLQLACLDQCKFQWQRLRSSEEGITSINMTDSNINIEIQDLLKSAKIVLDKLKRFA